MYQNDTRYLNYTPGMNRQAHAFPNPFRSLYPRAILTSFPNALAFCRYIWTVGDSAYRTAIERVIGHFITEVELVGQDARREEKRFVKDLLEQDHQINVQLRTLLCNYRALGNCIVSELVPFTRLLHCTCGTEYPYRVAYDKCDARLDATGVYFTGNCLTCKRKHVKFDIVDRKNDDPAKLITKFWNLEEIEIIWDPLTEKTEYVWKIPDYYIRRIKNNDPLLVEHAPKEVLECVQKNAYLKFHDDEIFHAKDPVLAGTQARGWGISPILSSFDDIVEVRLLRRANAAIAEDYVIPLRLLTPEVRSAAEQNAADPARLMNLGSDFVGRMNQIIQQKRINPTSWFAVPFPVRYQLVGGDAKQLVPHELLSFSYDQLLNGSGVPTDFYRGDLKPDTAPAMLRLLQSQWAPLIGVRDAFLSWKVRRICSLLSWTAMRARMIPPRQADDVPTKLAELQLMTGGQISQTSGLKAVNKDFEQELDLKIEEASMEAEKQMEAQQKQDEQAQGMAMQQQATPSPMQFAEGAQGGQPGGGQPGGGQAPPQGQPIGSTPDGNRSIEQTQADAQQLAANIAVLPPDQREGELRELDKKDETLHDLVVAAIKPIDQRAAQAGKAQILAQQGQQGGQ